MQQKHTPNLYQRCGTVCLICIMGLCLQNSHEQKSVKSTLTLLSNIMVKALDFGVIP